MGRDNRPHVHRCPRCRASEIERASRKGFVERLVLLLSRRRPYRCLTCGARFYDRRA
jgi:DNA-directed RNA polymerase subunit RPC12/RpoP